MSGSRLRGGGPEDERIALTAAPAQRRGADVGVAPGELVGEGEGEAAAGHPNRVAERDGAAIWVQRLHGHPEVARRGDGHRSKRLVDLDHVQLGTIEPAPP